MSTGCISTDSFTESWYSTLPSPAVAYHHGEKEPEQRRLQPVWHYPEQDADALSWHEAASRKDHLEQGKDRAGPE